ncbi:MAG: AAA family ATPase [Deltaproteobacteria bacterium]|nr:AAA family ATPase [Deltaproteobacteria bacterium]
MSRDPRQPSPPPMRGPEPQDSRRPRRDAMPPTSSFYDDVPASGAAYAPPAPPLVDGEQAAAKVTLSPRRAAPTLAPAAPQGRDSLPPRRAAFLPRRPRSWGEVGLTNAQVSDLILRVLLPMGRISSKDIAQHVGLPQPLVREVVHQLKETKHVTFVATNVVGDFICELSESGRDKSRQLREDLAWVGSAPVSWEAYLESVEAQALSRSSAGPEDLQRAFKDLLISEDLLDRLGPAITSTQPMFLHGEPGNGKTSIAERITACFGDTIWIPYVIQVGGSLIKLFDPAIHQAVPPDEGGPEDPRWVRIVRPTVVVGGELTLDMLELAHDQVSGITEAPLQLKANGGLLVVDDFGRGKTAPRDLLNRWIFPLEKKVDFLSLPDGRKLSVPFACMLVLSTNLEPRDLADEAFLRRIPYKVHVTDPDEYEFSELMERLAAHMGVRLSPRSVKYLVDRHYKLANRPMRYCHPRDLLQQVLHLARYRGEEPVAGPAQWDHVVRNYFGLV